MQAAATLGLLLTSTATASSPNGLTFASTQCFDDKLTDFLTANGIPGAALSVMRNGEFVYEQGYGTRDVPGVGADLARAAYANTPFRQASFAAGGRVTQTRDAAQYNSLVVLSIKYTKRRLNGSTARD
jgi:CubicO group peptidase (beta-lactamase class C family)